MISRFHQLLLALTTVTPLFLSIAIVLIVINPSGYACAWFDLFKHGILPDRLYWWVSTISIFVFFASWIWTNAFLHKLEKTQKNAKTIKLESIQYLSIGSIIPVFALFPPWLTFLMNKEIRVLVIITVLTSLAIVFIVSKQGYTSLVFLLCGYKRYEGRGANGMNIHLLTRKAWGNPGDIRSIVPLSDNLVLIV